jgi:uncharacterized protein YjbJ (UPF0337 family)
MGRDYLAPSFLRKGRRVRQQATRRGRREDARVATIHAGGSMSDKNIDEGKGRVKEATGSLTGDKSLKNEGKVDQAKSSVKDTVDKVGDKVTGKD